jgi:hypothetical protein
VICVAKVLWVADVALKVLWVADVALKVLWVAVVALVEIVELKWKTHFILSL